MVSAVRLAKSRRVPYEGGSGVVKVEDIIAGDLIAAVRAVSEVNVPADRIPFVGRPPADPYV